MLKFLKDTTLNMVSSFLVTFALQLLFFPAINKSIGQEDFGIFLSVIAIINFYSIALGTSFSNLYLKYYSKYKKKNIEKLSFDLYFKNLSIFNIFLLTFLCIIFVLFGFNYILAMSIICCCFLMTSRLYLLVWYRVKINYKKIFLVNLFLSILYLLFSFLRYMSLLSVFSAFLIIELITVILLIIFIKRDTAKEKHIQNKIKLKINKQEIFYLIISNVSNNALNYMDRWLITFLLNPAMVPIFYASTLCIKIFNQPLNVLSNVIFSYVANLNTINKKNKIILLIFGPFFSCITFLLGITVGPIIIDKIYPSYFSDAKDIYWIINLALSLAVMDFIFRGYLIKFYPLKLKMIIDLINMVSFLLLSILFTNYYKSLLGIAYAQLISYGIKNSIQYILILKLKSDYDPLINNTHKKEVF